MADIVSPEKRSKMMAGIRAKDTSPELIIRKGLHKRGYRYKLHEKKLPGKPDLVLAKRRILIFVHGCFWHGHNCHLFKYPKTRAEFWRKKIHGNTTRDEKAVSHLLASDWRVLVVWECALKGKKKYQHKKLLDEIERWIVGGSVIRQIGGDDADRAD